MRRLILAIVAASACVRLVSAAEPIARLVETVVVQADGSANVTVEIAMPAGGAAVEIPARGATIEGLVVRGGDRATVTTVEADGRRALIVSAGTPAAAAVKVAYRATAFVDFARAPLAHGNRTLAHSFANATRHPIAALELTVQLPPGYAVADIDDVEPTDGTAVEPPVRLTMRDGRQTVQLRGSGIRGGGAAGLTIWFRPRVQRWPLLVALALAGGAYLYRFRDLRRAETTRTHRAR
jgi:hypothetical protein